MEKMVKEGSVEKIGLARAMNKISVVVAFEVETVDTKNDILTCVFRKCILSLLFSEETKMNILLLNSLRRRQRRHKFL